jgi:tight adherence protein B
MPERSRSMMKHSPPPRKPWQAPRQPRQPGSLYSTSLPLPPHQRARAFRKEAAPSLLRKPCDYGTYLFSRRERLENILAYLCLCFLVSWLFYHSLLPTALFLPGIPLFLKARKESLLEKRKIQMLREFTTGMQLVNASLQAGYAVENAFRESLPELKKIYPSDSFIVREFRRIISQLDVSIPIEKALADLSARSHIDDIRNFSEVFQTAKRTGGDLMLIIRNTVSDIQEKSETREQIEADISGKVLEQKIMSLVPILIIAYVNLTSPDFLEVCYCTAAGRLVMTVCLGLYGIAFLWGRKVMKIQI